MYEVSWVPHGSSAWALCVALRRDVLRKPLGLEFTRSALDAEAADSHLAVFDGETLVGTLILSDRGGGVAQMRQVAVHDARQHTGIGRIMVDAFETEARRQGFKTIVLHARDTAVGFYSRLGYQPEGEPFVEVGIPHRTMTRTL